MKKYFVCEGEEGLTTLVKDYGDSVYGVFMAENKKEAIDKFIREKAIKSEYFLDTINATLIEMVLEFGDIYEEPKPLSDEQRTKVFFNLFKDMDAVNRVEELFYQDTFVYDEETGTIADGITDDMLVAIHALSKSPIFVTEI